MPKGVYPRPRRVVCKKCGLRLDSKVCKPCDAKRKRETYQKREGPRSRKNAENRVPADTLPCRKCKVGKRHSHGLCKPCKSAEDHEWYIKNRDRQRQYTKRYRSENRDRYEEYNRQYRALNREATAVRAKRWRSENPEKGRAQWHKRRALIRNSPGHYTVADWKAIVRKQKSRCVLCGSKCKLTVDHIIPLSKGGSNMAVNIQGLCLSCNVGKNDKVPKDVNPSLFDSFS